MFQAVAAVRMPGLEVYVPRSLFVSGLVLTRAGIAPYLRAQLSRTMVRGLEGKVRGCIKKCRKRRAKHIRPSSTVAVDAALLAPVDTCSMTAVQWTQMFHSLEDTILKETQSATSEFISWIAEGPSRERVRRVLMQLVEAKQLEIMCTTAKLERNAERGEEWATLSSAILKAISDYMCNYIESMSLEGNAENIEAVRFQGRQALLQLPWGTATMDLGTTEAFTSWMDEWKEVFGEQSMAGTPFQAALATVQQKMLPAVLHEIERIDNVQAKLDARLAHSWIHGQADLAAFMRWLTSSGVEVIISRMWRQEHIAAPVVAAIQPTLERQLEVQRLEIEDLKRALEKRSVRPSENKSNCWTCGEAGHIRFFCPKYTCPKCKQLQPGHPPERCMRK